MQGLEIAPRLPLASRTAADALWDTRTEGRVMLDEIRSHYCDRVIAAAKRPHLWFSRPRWSAPGLGYRFPRRFRTGPVTTGCRWPLARPWGRPRMQGRYRFQSWA